MNNVLRPLSAWTIPINSPAVKAAGAIHSDFEKKFIRAETVNWKTLVDLGGYPGVREKGLGVFPVAHLADGQEHGGDHGGATEDDRYDRSHGVAPQRFDQVGAGPHDHDEQSNRREVRVPIGHRLCAHLHEADHREQ